jgi:hypothetical protein
MKVLGSDYCQWLGWEESKTDESPRAFGIILHRDLGGVHWPDKRWMQYSHKPLRPPREKSCKFLKASHSQLMPWSILTKTNKVELCLNCFWN